MMLLRFKFILLFISAISSKCLAQLNDESIQIIKENSSKWNLFEREKNIDVYWKKLSNELKPVNVLFREVNIIDAKSGGILSDMDVLVSDGIIVKVGKKVTVPSRIKELTFVNSKGKYMLPGLTDAHVHMGNSNVDKLLNLVTGVTTVREMAASPWMVGYKNEVSNNSILAPNIYLAGKMLNQSDLWFFSEIVKEEEEAREKVRYHKALGYDFIKVWNVMHESLLEAIADECKKQQIDLIGHVPHNIPFRTAFELGFRTLEHYKGIILDQTLQLTEEDYLSVLDEFNNQEFWFCPTIALGNDGLRGKPAFDFLNNSAAVKYVPVETIEKWQALAKSTEFQSDLGNVSDSVFRMSKRIFKQLHGKGIKYLAGTDNNGSNLFMVPGFVLHRELELMNQLGMTSNEVLQTAIYNPADAMRKLQEFGTISVGKRADLILLENNPQEDLNNLLIRNEVMVRGIWLDKKKINEIQNSIKRMYSENSDLFNEPQKPVESLLNHFLNEENKYIIKPITYYLFSEALMEANLNEEANSVMKRAVNFYPEYWMYDQLGKTNAIIGDSEQARKNYEQSLKLYPHGRTARAWLQKN